MQKSKPPKDKAQPKAGSTQNQPSLTAVSQPASLQVAAAAPAGLNSPNRYGSFAEVRGGPNQVKWLIDGKDYMSAVADAIKAAQHEIFITDWQIHPYIHLKRPDTGVASLEWQLFELLKERAEAGVKIYIILYHDPKQVLDLGSTFAVFEFGKVSNITICRHGIGNDTIRWTHHEKLVVIDRGVAFVGGIDLCLGRWDTHTHAVADNYPCHPGVSGKIDEAADPAKKYCQWVGKDYRNTFLAAKDLDKHVEDVSKDILQNDEPIRTLVPRLPWHDVSCMFNGEAASDVAKHFIQRINDNCKKPGFQPISEDGPKVDHRIDNPNLNGADIQVVRSITGWSAGQVHEGSIHAAYVDAIQNAEHSIYIENQFFISSQKAKVKNEIQEALANRITLAYKTNKQHFRVTIILPLLPEFHGEFGESSGHDLEKVSYLNYATLCNGEHSLWAKLEKLGVPAEFRDRCVRVYGLRTHGVLNAKLVTELIYVHGKLMIVDDRKTLIGSANINDRSMLGDRDSEVDVVIEDREMIRGRMNGKWYKVGKFSHTLRCQLMKEHLGLLNGDDRSIDVSDPVSQKFHERLSTQATENTRIYDSVFKKLPTDQVQTGEDLEKWKKEKGLADTDPEKARDEVERIRGHIVHFPLLFLSSSDILKKPSLLDDITDIYT